MTKRFQHSFIDSCLIQFDQALRTSLPGQSKGKRNSPAETISEEKLSDSEKKHIAGLMRINHTGEVCAQALYAGQAATAILAETRESMEHAAREEIDHLAWCDERLSQLESQPSLLNPFWYGISFGMGAVAGIAGDKWSLGFVAETEQQVCVHLEEQLKKLPEKDKKSRAILEQMIVDERHHGESAREAGGAELPWPIKRTMSALSQLMKGTTYHI